jgi:hypothetical protein
MLLTISLAGSPASAQQVSGAELLNVTEDLLGAVHPRFSTPTETTLDPGRYWVRAIDPASGRESPRTLVKVAGARQLTIDVPVP